MFGLGFSRLGSCTAVLVETQQLYRVFRSSRCLNIEEEDMVMGLALVLSIDQPGVQSGTWYHSRGNLHRILDLRSLVNGEVIIVCCFKTSAAPPHSTCAPAPRKSPFIVLGSLLLLAAGRSVHGINVTTSIHRCLFAYISIRPIRNATPTSTS